MHRKLERIYSLFHTSRLLELILTNSDPLDFMNINIFTIYSKKLNLKNYLTNKFLKKKFVFYIFA